MGKIVLVRGVLRGMDREAECDVIVLRSAALRRAAAHTDAEHVYADFEVLDAPGDLPEGEYTIDVGEQVLSVRKQRGFWHSGHGCTGRF